MASSSDDQQSKPTDPPPPPPSAVNNPPPMPPPSTVNNPPPRPPPSAVNNPPPVYPPPPMGYPHGQGYPPAMGYPSAPHPGYPPAPGTYPPYNPYPYAQAPPAAYYNNNNNHPQYNERAAVHAGILRFMVTLLILMMVMMTMSSIITWILLRPEIPIFRVDSFAVANFNISKSNYSGNWDANVTVQNPNHKLNMYFERIQSFVDFKENALANAFVDTFFLDVEKSSQMRMRLISSSPDDPGNWASIEEKMERERATGMVSFNLRFFAWTTFRSGSWWKRHVVMRVVCEDLKLVFAGPAAGNAVFSPGDHPKNCAVLI